MYCVKCGRQCEKNEKRCPDCGMRLVTPARLKELLELERITNMTLAGRIRNAFKRFKKRSRRRLVAVAEKTGSFLSRLSVDLTAFLTLVGRLTRAGGRAMLRFGKRAGILLKKYAILGWKRLRLLAKRGKKAVAEKSSELKTLYRQEREQQQNLRNGKKSVSNARLSGSAAGRASKTGTAKGQIKTAAARTGHYVSGARSRAVSSSSKQNPRELAAALRTERDRPSGKNVQHSVRKRTRRPSYNALDRIKRVFTAEWAQDHLRSLVAMGLLLVALITFLFWGAFSDSGQKTLAQVGLGSAKGYMLIGDEYMADRNYSRAVEYYYTSLTKDVSYEAALKLAIAYSYTGDVSKEISALLICTENYPQFKLPFTQLYQLYPEGSARPARVQQAIEEGRQRYGSLE